VISGRTRSAAVIGSPIRHSLSPAIFNAAFDAAALDWAYLAFDVPEGATGLALGGVRALGIEGLSVTMPHKAAVLAGLDHVSPDVEALGACNCITNRGGELYGDTTDGAGLLDALVDEGFDVAGRRVGIVGAGGAGRAVARALGGAGASEVLVVNRSEGPAAQAAALAGPPGRVATSDQLANVDLVVNATPLGMGIVVATDGTPEPLPLDVDRLGAGQLVVDLVYHPPVTPLLAAARGRGIRGVNGVGMLVHQAAHAFRLWTGEDPPLEAMSAAVVAGLAHREAEEFH
jgi:shikimate dehydrogenase